MIEYKTAVNGILYSKKISIEYNQLTAPGAVAFGEGVNYPYAPIPVGFLAINNTDDTIIKLQFFVGVSGTAITGSDDILTAGFSGAYYFPVLAVIPSYILSNGNNGLSVSWLGGSPTTGKLTLKALYYKVNIWQ